MVRDDDEFADDGYYSYDDFYGRPRKKSKRHVGRSDFWGEYEDGAYSHRWSDPYYNSDWWKNQTTWTSLKFNERGNAVNALLDKYCQERLRFLTRAWSNGEVKSISAPYRQDMFTATSELEKGSMELPMFTHLMRKLGLDTLNLNDKRIVAMWRLIRMVAWHEAMHFQYTPLRWAARCENAGIDKIIFNILEDAKVNDLGLEEYPGMVSEEMLESRLHTYMYKRLNLLSRSFDQVFYLNLVQFLNLNNPNVQVTHEDDLQALKSAREKYISLMNQYRNSNRNDVALRTLDFGIFDLALELTQYMHSAPIRPEGTPSVYGNETVESFVWSVPTNNGRTEGLDKDARMMEALSRLPFSACLDHNENGDVIPPDTDLNDLLEASMSSCPQDVMSEIQEVVELKKNLDRHKGTLNDISGDAIVPLVPYEEYLDRTVMSRVIAALRKWKDSYENRLGPVGMDLDVEQMIIDEIKQTPVDNYYISDERVAPRDKILFLLDVSGSMEGYLNTYKKGLVTMFTALDFLHISYAISYFSSEAPEVMCIVKDFDKRINWAEKMITATLGAGGGTPLGTALQMMTRGTNSSQRQLFKSCQYLVVLTDGGPTDASVFPTAYECLKESGKPYIFVGMAGEHDSVREKVCLLAHFVSAGISDKDRIIIGMDELPKVVLNMIIRQDVIS